MKNTAIVPTYLVEVKFSWQYPSKPLQTITKSGFINSKSNDNNEIAQTFIETFIKNYEVGVCIVSDIVVENVKRRLTYDEWVEKYKPIKNKFEKTTLFGGCAFDYSEEDQWEFLKKQNPKNVWTMVSEGDDSFIISGFHWVNRDFYFVTKKEVEIENLSSEYMVIE
jgi:hypothetical protein